MDDLNEELQALIVQSEDLFFKNKLDELDNLICDEVLEEHGYHNILNTFLFLLLFESEIEVNEDEIKEYSEYSDILDWQKKMLLGFLAIKKKDYEGAKEQFMHCYQLREETKFVFYIALCQLQSKDYWTAASNYTICIDNKFEHSNLHFLRGRSYQLAEEIDKALFDYNEQISHGDSNAFTFFSRGLCYDQKSNFEEALKDYDRAIELDPKIAVAYLQKAIILDKKGKLEDTYRCLDEAKAKCDIGARTNVYFNLVALVYKRNINYDGALFKMVDFFMKIATLVKPYRLSEKEGDRFFGLLIGDVLPAIVGFSEIAMNIDDVWPAVEGSYKKPARMVAHYTNLETVDKLVMVDDDLDDSSDENIVSGKLRYSNTAFLNDPVEGRVLFDYFKASGIGSNNDWDEIVRLFDHGKIINSDFYIGSFLPVDDSHEDDLVMWRTYGKDSAKNEAAGCCLIIDTSFFDKHFSTPRAIQSQVKRNQFNYSQFEIGLNQPLYRVLYYNRRSNRFFNISNSSTKQDTTSTSGIIEDKDRDIKNFLNRIATSIIKLNESVFFDKRLEEYENNKLNSLKNEVITYVLSELRFFFKSADYSYENELRVVVSGQGRNVEISKEDVLPRRTYVESKYQIKPYLRKIILGPKVSTPDRWVYLDTKMKRDKPLNAFELVKSRCDFQ